MAARAPNFNIRSEPVVLISENVSSCPNTRDLLIAALPDENCAGDLWGHIPRRGDWISPLHPTSMPPATQQEPLRFSECPYSAIFP